MVGKVVVNVRGLHRQSTGVETYTGELAARLRGARLLAAPPTWLPSLAGHAWEQCVLPGQIRPGEALWSPANSGPLWVARQALSLHDTFVLDHPEWFSSLYAAWHRLLLPRLAGRVRKVLTVSEWSARQIRRYFPSLCGRLAVIPPGVDRRRFYPRSPAEVDDVRRRYNLPEDFVLFVGTLEPRKNLPRLLQAWAQLSRDFPCTGLVLAGGAPRRRVHRPWSSTGAPTGTPLPPSSVRFLGYVPAADLPVLYSAARLLVMPSLAEGFGLPALEAMACGTPVAASHGGALPETLGGAGLLFDPLAPSAIAEAMRCVLEDDDFHDELRRKGLRRAGQFSWRASAHQLAQVLEEVAA